MFSWAWYFICNTLRLHLGQLILPLVVCCEQGHDGWCHKLFLLQKHWIFFFFECSAKSMECTPIFVKIGINYYQEIISMKLKKFRVLYTTTMKGGKQLLRKSSMYLSHLCTDPEVWQDPGSVHLVWNWKGKTWGCVLDWKMHLLRTVSILWVFQTWPNKQQKCFQRLCVCRAMTCSSSRSLSFYFQQYLIWKSMLKPSCHTCRI